MIGLSAHGYDAGPALHQNWHRDYSPATGRYLQVDPLLSPNRLVTEEWAFLVPALAAFPEWLAPYNYVANRPLQETDPWGLGPLHFLKCIYYSREVARYGQECESECPNDTEGKVKFMEKHGASFMGEAMLTCTCEKAGPDFCSKWLANCATTPIMKGAR